MDVVLHIGRHKTGTSAIQWHLVDTPYSGICYPLTGRVREDGRVQPGHHTLARVLGRDGPESADRVASLARSIREESRGCELLLLSSEAFQELDEAGLVRLRRFLDLLRPDSIQIICYLREYLEYLMSSFQQAVHEDAYTFDFVAYSESFEKRVLLDQFITRWRGIGTWRSFLYGRYALPDGDVVTHFLSQIGVSRNDDTVLRPVSLNPSISGALLVTKAGLNYSGSVPLPNYTALMNLAINERNFRGPFRVSRQAAARLRQRTSYNSLLRHVHPGLRLSSFDDLPPLPDHDSFTTDLLKIAEALNLTSDQVETVAGQLLPAERWFSQERER